MPQSDIILSADYQDFWSEYTRSRTPAAMYKYIAHALRALKPRAEAYTAAEVDAFVKAHAAPITVTPPLKSENLGTSIQVKILNQLGQKYFDDGSTMEFLIAEAIENAPTDITVGPTGELDVYKSRNVSFWEAFKSELMDTLNAPHTQLFLQFMIGDWVASGGLKTKIGNPLSGIMSWFNKIKPDWADDIKSFTDKLSSVWKRITPDWMNSLDGVKTRVAGVWDFLTPDWMNSVNGIKTEYDKFQKWFAAGLTEVIKDIKKDLYGNALLITDSLKKGLTRWKTSGEKFIDLQMEVADIVKNPGNWLDENFTVPLRTMKGNLDVRLSAVANYLALFGIMEGRQARAYTDRLIDRLIQPADKVSMRIERWEKQVEVTLQEFAGDDFKKAQQKVDRITPIIDAAIELLDIKDPETARIAKEPWGRSIGTYPATTVSLLEAGVSHSLPMKVTYPAPVDNTLPEIRNASYMIDRIMENLYIGTDGKPINEALGKDGIMTTDPTKIIGKVKTVMEVYEHPDLTTFDDLACNCAFGSAAQDEGSILDTVWSIASDIPLGVMSLMALRLCRLPYKYLLYPAVFEYTLQAVDWYVSEPEDYTDRLDEFNADFWNSIIQWSERSDELEPWLPTP